MYKGEGNDTYYIGGADRHIVPDFFRSGTGHAKDQSQKGHCGSPGKESQQNSGGIPLYIDLKEKTWQELPIRKKKYKPLNLAWKPSLLFVINSLAGKMQTPFSFTKYPSIKFRIY